MQYLSFSAEGLFLVFLNKNVLRISGIFRNYLFLLFSR